MELNEAVLFTTLEHLRAYGAFTCGVSDMSIGEFRLAYETYHTRIPFFEIYVRTLRILFYASSSYIYGYNGIRH